MTHTPVTWEEIEEIKEHIKMRLAFGFFVILMAITGWCVITGFLWWLNGDGLYYAYRCNEYSSHVLHEPPFLACRDNYGNTTTFLLATSTYP